MKMKSFMFIALRIIAHFLELILLHHHKIERKKEVLHLFHDNVITDESVFLLFRTVEMMPVYSDCNDRIILKIAFICQFLSKSEELFIHSFTFECAIYL